MPRFANYPTTIEDLLQISITKLKQWEYLAPNQAKSGTLNWSRNGNPTACISIYVDMMSYRPYLELSYKSNGEPRNYKIYLERTPSNLGKGEMWHFICPKTLKPCRKLYLRNGYFYHRTAHKGMMYEKQLQSKKARELEMLFGKHFDLERHYLELNKKHLKKMYKGKPTKRYARLCKAIQEGENVSIEQFEKMMLR